MGGYVYNQRRELCIPQSLCGMDAVYIFHFNVQIDQIETRLLFCDSTDQLGTVKEQVTVNVNVLPVGGNAQELRKVFGQLLVVIAYGNMNHPGYPPVVYCAAAALIQQFIIGCVELFFNCFQLVYTYMLDAPLNLYKTFSCDRNTLQVKLADQLGLANALL